MAYNFTAQWLKSATNNAPDTLSRHSVCNPQPADNLAERDAYNTPRCCLLNFGPLETHSLEYLKASICKSCAKMLNKRKSTGYYALSY